MLYAGIAQLEELLAQAKASSAGLAIPEPKYQQQTEPSTGKIKACVQCGTTRTPKWREGPYGPKTLCNSCGLKRVKATKAQQQGKNPSQVANPAGASGKKKSSAAAR